MSNSYPGICYRCGELVKTGDGVFEKVSRSQYKKWPDATFKKWLTQHHHCASDYRGTSQHYIYNDMRKKETKN